ncbi:P2X purinoceptor 7-like [Ruditapes philippinarum]|uniref:P2X purinoceptor 7-like n=1 Tax=Ruditapes philippinarum TaxID=129788 RepID=UPI00295C33B0|nr:P2X purinoceptor 7-like [Ruditapes philippinarum]
MADSSSASTSSDTTIDYEPVVSQRGRGKGRGRGKSTSARGKGSARGRGGTRGKRKQTGTFHLGSDEVSRLNHLKEERKRKADDLVDRLSEEGARKILKAVAEKMPSLVIDLAEQLQREEGPSSPGPDEPDQPNQPHWCICGRCREMPTDSSRVCCGMRPELCHSIMPEMDLTITDPGVLQLQQLYRNDVFARLAVLEEDVNASMRHAAYRQYVLFHHGKLGQGERRPVPSCATWVIRDKYPDPNNYYIEYVPSW